jgi:hypothetical protein
LKDEIKKLTKELRGKKSKIKRIKMNYKKKYMINCKSRTKLKTFKKFIIEPRKKISNKIHKD